MVYERSNSDPGRHRRALGTFPNRRAAEQVLNELRESGFPMDRVSVITKDSERQGHDKTSTHGGNKSDDGATLGATTGGALGGITGLLVGLGTLAIPGIGPIMLAGATATALATTLAGTAIGAVTGGLLGALAGLGIPEKDAQGYHDRIMRGEYLVIVDGTDSEIARAEQILHHRGIADYKVYDAPIAKATTTTTDERVATRPQAAVPMTTTPVVTQSTTSHPSHTDAYPTSSARQHHRRAIGVFSHRRDTESALSELRNAGFSMDQISVLAKDAGRGSQVAGVDVQKQTGNKADDGAKAGAATGATLGGLGGLLVGLGTLAIPGIGPVVLGGAVATAIATTLTGGAIGAAAGGLAGALVGLGIPENRAKVYNDRFNRGDDLVMVDGSEADIRKAEAILKRHRIEEWESYDATDVHTNTPATGADRSTVQNTDLRGIQRDRTPTDTGVISTKPEVVIVDHRTERR